MTRKKKAAAPMRLGSAAKKSTNQRKQSSANSAAAQRARLLAALSLGPISTIEARRRLDVLMPAARVHELRHQAGHNIIMTWIRQSTDAGRLHRVALYSMHPGKWGEA
jgi:hypothetical protein